MTDKELLAELKVCYEYLNDIRDNHEDRFDTEEEKLIWKMEEQINDLYEKVYKMAIESEYRDELKIKTTEDLESEIVIGKSVYDDYNFVKKGTFEFQTDKYNDLDIITCGDLGIYWYNDELENIISDDNIRNKVVEIEDYNGNTLMSFEVDKNGIIGKYDNCDIADIDSCMFGTDKDLMRIQMREDLEVI